MYIICSAICIYLQSQDDKFTFIEGVMPSVGANGGPQVASGSFVTQMAIRGEAPSELHCPHPGLYRPCHCTDEGLTLPDSFGRLDAVLFIDHGSTMAYGLHPVLTAGCCACHKPWFCSTIRSTNCHIFLDISGRHQGLPESCAELRGRRGVGSWEVQ